MPRLIEKVWEPCFDKLSTIGGRDGPQRDDDPASVSAIARKTCGRKCTPM